MILSTEQMTNEVYKKQAEEGKIINITLCPVCNIHIKTKDGWQKYKERIIKDILNDPRLKNGNVIKEVCDECNARKITTTIWL